MVACLHKSHLSLLLAFHPTLSRSLSHLKYFPLHPTGPIDRACSTHTAPPSLLRHCAFRSRHPPITLAPHDTSMEHEATITADLTPTVGIIRQDSMDNISFFLEAEGLADKMAWRDRCLDFSGIFVPGLKGLSVGFSVMCIEVKACLLECTARSMEEREGCGVLVARCSFYCGLLLNLMVRDTCHCGKCSGLLVPAEQPQGKRAAY